MHLGPDESGSREPGELRLGAEALLLQGTQQAGHQRAELRREVDEAELTRRCTQGLQSADQSGLGEQRQTRGAAPRERPEGPFGRFENLSLRRFLPAPFGMTTPGA